MRGKVSLGRQHEPGGVPRGADVNLSLPDALVLLPPDGWTRQHREMLHRDVFRLIDERRCRAKKGKLSAEERAGLLTRIRRALVTAYPEAGISGRPEITKRCRPLTRMGNAVRRATAALGELRIDDQHRLSVLTFDAPELLEPAQPTHLSRELRAMERAVQQLDNEIRQEPRTPRDNLKRDVVGNLVGVFEDFTDTEATRLVGPSLEGKRTVTGRLVQFVGALLPPALHDPAVGLDHQIRVAIQERRRTKKSRRS